MESTFFSDMAEDFKQLFETMEGYDIKIYAGDDSQESHAHSLVLRARSPYFRGALSSELVKKEKGYFIFKKPNISAPVLKVILKWVYCGIVHLREYDGPEILKILIASDELGLQKLIDFIQKFLIDNRDDFLRQDPVGMLYIITRHLGFGSLKKFCLETICSDPDILFKSNKYLTLEEEVFILILKCDDLAIDEIELWDCLIKWGIEQKPKLNKDKEKGYFIFKKPNISAPVLKVILKWVYCGIVHLREYDGPEILKILIASDELGLQRLIDFIQKFLIDNRDDFLRQDPVGMLYIITRHLGFGSLKKFCLETICSDPDILFKSNKYLTLEEEVFILILKCDDLAIDEIELWDCLIKWGIEQKPKLNKDVKKFTDKDFKTLKERLHNCIPLIRFHEISMKDFYLKIRPFRKIISGELEDDILRCYMIPDAKPAHNMFPPRKIALDSLLINKKVTFLFASWIDKQQNTYYWDSEKKMPYKFELLFRCSRDGNSSYTFHQKCDNQGATIVIAKIQNSDRLVGGYNPLDWNSNGYKTTYDSFLFSMNDKNNISGATIGRILQSHGNAIFCNNGYGPTFGSSHDLYCPNGGNNWSCSRSSYNNINLPSSFIVSDWEVFKVVKEA
ncbi:hypothetical protein Glove_21g339 [Diversispora epigaea]|uniref:BTB domain-containing protein n=1 Tax=Diversispora epigaea TaxID=1348612 RepID=A0A397JK80_9GLOM|nr:hypothetical protein Glove_21g339 [Diversispora epigaea]